MKIRLYFDEDAMDRDLVDALRSRRVDVVTAHEAGMRKREDSEHLAYASAQSRVVYTFNTGISVLFMPIARAAEPITRASSCARNSVTAWASRCAASSISFPPSLPRKCKTASSFSATGDEKSSG